MNGECHEAAETTSLKCMNVNFEMCKMHENETQYGPQM
jgi:hypothetical protein